MAQRSWLAQPSWVTQRSRATQRIWVAQLFNGAISVSLSRQALAAEVSCKPAIRRRALFARACCAMRRSLAHKQRVSHASLLHLLHTPPNLQRIPSQQLPSLLEPRILLPLARRSEMQTQILFPHHLIWDQVPLIHRNQIHRKQVHRPCFILAPLRPHHIQAVLSSTPAVNRGLHLHPQNSASAFHSHVIPGRVPIRLRHSHPQPHHPRHKTKLRPLPALLAPSHPPSPIYALLHASPSPRLSSCACRFLP